MARLDQPHDDQCLWMLRRPRGRGWTFCPNDRVDGDTFCEDHRT